MTYDWKHEFEHPWIDIEAPDPVLNILSAELAAVTPASVRIEYCEKCDLYRGRAIDDNGTPMLGLSAQALVHGRNVLGR